MMNLQSKTHREMAQKGEVDLAKAGKNGKWDCVRSSASAADGGQIQEKSRAVGRQGACLALRPLNM